MDGVRRLHQSCIFPFPRADNSINRSDSDFYDCTYANPFTTLVILTQDSLNSTRQTSIEPHYINAEAESDKTPPVLYLEGTNGSGSVYRLPIHASLIVISCFYLRGLLRRGLSLISATRHHPLPSSNSGQKTGYYVCVHALGDNICHSSRY